MANLVITSTANSVLVDFGDYAEAVGLDGCWNKAHIIKFVRSSDDTQVEAEISNGMKWHVAHTNTVGCFIIDTVAGVAPTGNEDLYNKLSALIE